MKKFGPMLFLALLFPFFALASGSVSIQNGWNKFENLGSFSGLSLSDIYSSASSNISIAYVYSGGKYYHNFYQPTRTIQSTDQFVYIYGKNIGGLMSVVLGQSFSAPVVSPITPTAPVAPVVPVVPAAPAVPEEPATPAIPATPTVSTEIAVESETIKETTACPIFLHDLYPGLSDAETGGEVSKLQRLLAVNPVVYSGEITGFYGNATKTAVEKWQCIHNVICSSYNPEDVGYGYFGPRTRAKLYEECGRQETTSYEALSSCPVATNGKQCDGGPGNMYVLGSQLHHETWESCKGFCESYDGVACCAYVKSSTLCRAYKTGSILSWMTYPDNYFAANCGVSGSSIDSGVAQTIGGGTTGGSGSTNCSGYLYCPGYARDYTSVGCMYKGTKSIPKCDSNGNLNVCPSLGVCYWNKNSNFLLTRDVTKEYCSNCYSSGSWSSY
ncbi:MAG: hypothetical protein ABII97_00110 [Patescibacteria group bacterium]